MKLRFVTAVIALALFALVVVLGRVALFVLICGFNILALYEYIHTVRNHPSIVDYGLVIFCGTALLFIGAFWPAYLLYALSFALILVFIRNIFGSGPNAEFAAMSVWAVVYISLSLSFAAEMLFGAEGHYFLLLIIIATIMCDTMAYFGGYLFGKNKLCEFVSPKKTKEGAVSGFLFAVATCLAGYYLTPYLPLPSYTLWVYILCGVLIGIFAQFGDLSASLIKRRYNIKDYGNLLPGHGGALDRIDGMLFSFSVVYVFLNVFVKG
jgi:phosphatidate cytidylyltransferase